MKQAKDRAENEQNSVDFWKLQRVDYNQKNYRKKEIAIGTMMEAEMKRNQKLTANNSD